MSPISENSNSSNSRPTDYSPFFEEAKLSGIPLDLWQKNFRYSIDHVQFNELRKYDDQTKFTSNRDVKLFWWHLCLNPETAQLPTLNPEFLPQGSIKVNDLEEINRKRDIRGVDNLSKYLNFPKDDPTIPFFACVTLEVIEKVAEFYEIPIEDILIESRKNTDYGLWEWVKNTQVPVVLTEGAKKALALLACGIVAISVPGVGCGYKVTKFQKKIERIKIQGHLAGILGHGRNVWMSYDMDMFEKGQVSLSLDRTIRALYTIDCKVQIASWYPSKDPADKPETWQDKLCKGIDDLKYAHGVEAVRAVFKHLIPWDIFKFQLVQKSKEEKWTNELQANFKFGRNGSDLYEIGKDCILTRYGAGGGETKEIYNSRVSIFLSEKVDVPDDDEASAGISAKTDRNVTRVSNLWYKSTYLDRQQINPAGLFAFQNKIVSFENGQADELEYPQPELFNRDINISYFTEKLPCEWNPEKWPLEACLTALTDTFDTFDSHEEAMIFFKVVSCCLNLREIHKRHNRAVRAILLIGEGRNGKDTLADLVRYSIGSSNVGNYSLNEFRDHGEKNLFSLYGLDKYLINMPSENNPKRLDMQSLKMAITGEQMRFAEKGKNAFVAAPQAAHVFSMNESPHLSSRQAHQTSRFAFINLHKTFVGRSQEKLGKNEFRGKPELRNPKFIQENLSAPFMHLLYWLYQDVYENSIDYQCLEANMEQNLLESNHLLEFLKTYYTHDPGCGESVRANDVLQMIHRYYVCEGVANWKEIGSSKVRFITDKYELGGELARSQKGFINSLKKLGVEMIKRKDKKGNEGNYLVDYKPNERMLELLIEESNQQY